MGFKLLKNMGTRNLTMVTIDNQTKVAQYGQWDGDYGSVGQGVLDFIKGVDLPKFKEQVRCLNWITEEQSKIVEETPNWSQIYPYLSRDIAEEVLTMIHRGDDIIGLSNNEEFAQDSLFCEYAYVLDLDNEVFEVYRGFQTEPQEGNRFGTKERDRGEYYPVKLVKKYSFSELPDDLSELYESDED